jgi:chromosome segregation ATPase
MAGDTQLANELISWAIGVPSIGVVVAYGISMIRRRMSADTKAVKEDKSYQDMLESYRRERDETKADRDRIIIRMSAIETERNEAVGKVGKLTAEVEFLSSQVTELKVLVEKLGTSLESARTEMHRFAVENAKLAAHVSYLEEIVEQSNDRKREQGKPGV